MARLKLLPPQLRLGLWCYICHQPAKYIVDDVIHFRDGDINIQVPMCNKCALTHSNFGYELSRRIQNEDH